MSWDWSVGARRRLRSLYLYFCPGITDLAPLGDNTSLECLYIKGCPGVTNYGCLRGMTNLRALGVERKSFNSWKLLRSCQNLEWLTVESPASVAHERPQHCCAVLAPPGAGRLPLYSSCQRHGFALVDILAHLRL